MKIEKVLVPIDFSDGALEALRYSIDLAKKIDAELLVLFVVQPLPTTGGELYAGPMDPSVILEEQRRIAREQMSRLERRLAQRGVRFKTAIETGTPYRTIVEVGKRSRSDLIVMATHGRAGFSHLLLGSVTEKVIRTAPCPVLTLRTYDSANRQRATRTKRHP